MQMSGTHADVRNSFLSGVLGESIVESDLMDSSLNPFKSYSSLRELINSKDAKELMATIKSQPPKKTGNKLAQQRIEFLTKLVPLYTDLVDAFPEAERSTPLDIVCKTRHGLINLEVQVQSQNYWDIRILHHVCGLFHRQFVKGFQWTDLQSEDNIGSKVKRVIGVSILQNAPVDPQTVTKLLPWYSMAPWDKNEFHRHYRLLETSNPQKQRAGIEFHDYNLAALRHIKPEIITSHQGGNVLLKEWLELLAFAHLRKYEGANYANDSTHTEQVKKAYKLIECRTLPTDVKNQYLDSQSRYLDYSPLIISYRTAKKRSQS
jgi:hypothetical protein